MRYTEKGNVEQRGEQVYGSRNTGVLGRGRAIVGENTGNNSVWQSGYDSQAVPGRMGDGKSDPRILPKEGRGPDRLLAGTGAYATESLRHDEGILGDLSKTKLSGVARC